MPDVGLLAAKIRTIEGQEVTIPNSVLVGTSTTSYTRLGLPDGMIVSSTVTIGYDAPPGAGAFAPGGRSHAEHSQDT